MSPLQWALLIFAVIAIVAIYFFSRRDRRAMSQDEEGADALSEASPKPSGRERQLDIFGSEGQQFDEFGVGKPRRVEPRFDLLLDSDEPAVVPARGPTLAPATPPPSPKPVAAEKPQPQAQSPAQSQKIVSLLIGKSDGTKILGLELHAALEQQGLEFGARQIYHRLSNDEVVFSVASLLKPGHLDPAAAESFATLGLTLFMVLPGPVRASDAIRDMIGTADRLAEMLSGEVYDAKKQAFTPSSARALQQEVEAWARTHSPS